MRGFYKFLLLTVVVFATAVTAHAQNSVKGKITDALIGDALIGANILVKGTSNGTAIDATGRYTLNNVDKNATLIVTSIGYATTEVEVNGRSLIDIELNAGTTELSAIEVLASRATKETPFSYTTVDKKALQASLGSRDIPLALNTTPSVYLQPRCNYSYNSFQVSYQASVILLLTNKIPYKLLN
ncbi:MAG: carboxypeptidase-like regulatory domain-containing protein [Bacteroidia bacterium]